MIIPRDVRYPRSPIEIAIFLLRIAETSLNLRLTENATPRTSRIRDAASPAVEGDDSGKNAACETEPKARVLCQDHV